VTARGAVALRPATPQDAPFLAHVYAGTRDDLRMLPVPEPARAALVAQQHRSREQQHAAAYPAAASEVVEVDGAAVGRLVVDHAEHALHVVDVAVLPEHRGRGIGAEALRTVLARADDRGVPVTLWVAADNPAQRLYARLGFRPTAPDGALGEHPAVHVALVRPARGPDGQAKTAS
jgi:ribosomal protein S18 acetylase RimI-like enzyme